MPPTWTYPPPPPPPSTPTQQGDEPSTQGLKFHFYATTCPNTEDLVMAEMKLIRAEDPTLMPALVRLHFHDCFIRISNFLCIKFDKTFTFLVVVVIKTQNLNKSLANIYVLVLTK
jgi:hypothetical protein